MLQGKENFHRSYTVCTGFIVYICYIYIERWRKREKSYALTLGFYEIFARCEKLGFATLKKEHTVLTLSQSIVYVWILHKWKIMISSTCQFSETHTRFWDKVGRYRSGYKRAKQALTAFAPTISALGKEGGGGRNEAQKRAWSCPIWDRYSRVRVAAVGTLYTWVSLPPPIFGCTPGS